MDNFQKWQSLSLQHKEIASIFFKNKFTGLKNRSANALTKFINSNSDPASLLKSIPNNDFDFAKIPNIGVGTTNDLLNFYKNFITYLQRLAILPENSSALIDEKNRVLLNYTFVISEDMLNEIFNKKNELGYFPVFQTIGKLLKANQFKNKHRLFFYNQCLGYQQDILIRRKPAAVNEELDLTVERCQQLINKFVVDFPTDFAFLNTLSLDFQLAYQLNLNANLIKIEDDDRIRINRSENTVFSNRFITKILAILSHEMYLVLGHEYDIANSWKQLYLIKSEIDRQFDFYGFIAMLKRIRSDRNELSYNLSIKEQLQIFKRNENINEDCIIEVIKILTTQETDLVCNERSEVVIPQNTPIQLWQYMEDALLTLGKKRTGHSLGDIICFLQKRYPKEIFNESSLASIVSGNAKFIYFGRDGLYGLKVWEEAGDIKGGTIRDIVYDFLESKSEPQHIEQIFEYVKKFRDTDVTSLYSNLQQEKKNKFTLLSSKFIGIQSKNYSNWQKPLKIFGGLFSRRNLLKFDGTNFSEVKESFIKRGYFEIQISAIFNKKIIDEEIIVDEQGLFWINNIHGYSKLQSEGIEEEMIKLTLQTENSDEEEQEQLLKMYSSLSKEEIMARLNDINQDTESRDTKTSDGYKRNNIAIVLIKMLRGFKCQICEHTIIKKDGSSYIEAAHITPKYQKGKETRDNILLLCPNHHKEFDLGDLNTIIRTSTTIEFVLNNYPHVIALD